MTTRGSPVALVEINRWTGSGEGTLTYGVMSCDKVRFCSNLEFNILSVSQIFDKKYYAHFDESHCYVLKPGFIIYDEWIILKTPRLNNIYILDMNIVSHTS